MVDAVWRNFLSGGEDDAEGPPRVVHLLRSARVDAKAAQEDANSKEEQVALMTAMLQAAEEELQLRSNQLEITNAMLKATDAELIRKDEQLEITTQMLRKAEEEISRRENERRAMRKELARMRDILPRTARADLAEQPAAAVSYEALALVDEPARVFESRRSTVETASAAGAVVGELEARLAASLASIGDEQQRLGAALPVELPEQRGSRHPCVLLAHPDSVSAMRPMAAVPDARDQVNDINSRAVNQRLSVPHTSMRLEDSFDERAATVATSNAYALSSRGHS